MTNPNQDLERFNTKKAEMQEYAKSVQLVIDEQNKTKAILEALQNEKAEYIARQKEKFATTGEMSADEYVELRNKESGLNARIEYYTALLVDIDDKVYQAKEELYKLQQSLIVIRSNILEEKANRLLEEIIAREKDNLGDLFTFLYLAGKINPNPLTRETKETKIIDFIKDKIGNNIPNNKPLNTEYVIYSEQLKGFEPKRPTQKHRESFEPKKQGLADLINLI